MGMQFVLGFLASFLSSTPPGILNLTSLKISLEKGSKKSAYFALGVSIIIFIQTYISLAFATLLLKNAGFENFIKRIDFVVFTAFSIYFFYTYNQERKQKLPKNKFKIKNTFLLGIVLASLNMLAIPFYLAVGTILNKYGWFTFTQFNILLFVSGSAFGVFSLLSIYSKSAQIIQNKIGFFAKYLNFIIGLLTGVIAVILLIEIF